MRLWVHRLSTSAGGDPASSLPERAYELFRVIREFRKPFSPLSDDLAGAREFLVSELLERNTMRQGWGVPGLDLTKSTFHDNYVIAMRRYWKAVPQETVDELVQRETWDDGELTALLDPYYREAEGRYKVLRRMQEMGRSDVVFFPGTPTPDAFTVARIDDVKYQFEDRSAHAKTKLWELDFGHRRQVKDVRTFKYGPSTMPASMLGSPYKNPVDKVNARSEKLQEFVATQYK